MDQQDSSGPGKAQVTQPRKTPWCLLWNVLVAALVWAAVGAGVVLAYVLAQPLSVLGFLAVIIQGGFMPIAVVIAVPALLTLGVRLLRTPAQALRSVLWWMILTGLALLWMMWPDIQAVAHLQVLPG